MAGWFLDEIGELSGVSELHSLRGGARWQEKTFRMIGDTADFAWM